MNSKYTKKELYRDAKRHTKSWRRGVVQIVLFFIALHCLLHYWFEVTILYSPLAALFVTYLLIRLIAFLGERSVNSRIKNRASSEDADKFFLKCLDKNNEFFKGKHVTEVPQRYFGFAHGGNWIGTPHVEQCTLFFGKCCALELAFVCHVDVPSCLTGFPDFFDELEKEIQAAVENSDDLISGPFTFKCHILGGESRWGYPLKVRQMMTDYIYSFNESQTNIKICLKEHAICYRNNRFALSVNAAKDGSYASYYENVKHEDGMPEKLTRSKQINSRFK